MKRLSGLLATLFLIGLAVTPLRLWAGQATGPKVPPLVIPSMYGSDLFTAYCASCHGRDGRGQGTVAPVLKVAVPDLTTLSARHGGTFPAPWVESFVTGNREPVTAHGSKEMPVWGPIFQALEPNPAANRVRIENIVAHIASLQAAK